MSTVAIAQPLDLSGTRKSVQTAEKGGLLSSSYLGLLVTQFLGALNDNMFRLLVIPIGKYHVGPQNEALALSAGLACFTIPYLLLAAPAGYLADRFSKRTVIVGCKIAEVVIMLLGVAAIYYGNIYLLFLVVALMGGQSAIFAPSKYGSLPEMLRTEKLSAANGLIGLTTILAVIAGAVAGGVLYSMTGVDGTERLWISAAALLGVAGLGLLASLRVRPLPIADLARRFPLNPIRQTLRDLAMLGRNASLLRVAMGIAFFWCLASLAQMSIDQYAVHELGLAQGHVGVLLAVLAIGVGTGNVLAGIWSRGRVELGLVPLGALGMAASAMMLWTSADSYAWTCVWLFLLGAGGGMFDVPLEAFIQHESPNESRGATLAANNFLTFSGTLVVAGLFTLLRGSLGLPPRAIFLFAGLLALAAAIYAGVWLAAPTLRWLVRLVAGAFYRVSVTGMTHVPASGGAILVANHISWIDGVLLLITSPRPIRMLGYADYMEKPWIRPLARLMGVIPIRPGAGRKSIVASLRQASDAAKRGELVCVFPEGAISRDGKLGEFKPGVLRILRQSGVPVIPVYLDGLWGSIFSYRDGKILWKWPRRWRYPVLIHYGTPVAACESVEGLRNAVEKVGIQAVQSHSKRDYNLPRTFVRMCRKNMSHPKIADSTGMEMTGAQLLLRTFIFRRLLQREVLAADEKYVGLILPPSGGGVLANAALPLCHRITVNLNYTCSSEIINSCIEQCGIRHVLTSRRVMERLDLQIDAELIYLEDLIKKVRTSDKIVAALQTYLIPRGMLERSLGLNEIQEDDVLTVLFTSGSTGEPKGVMLTHKNVGSNVQAIDETMHLRSDDVAIGVLPFFHSYGYTATLWTVLLLSPKGAYHFNPLEAQQVGKLVEKHGGTILLSTPTFLRGYLKRVKPEQFASLDSIMASAEKLPRELSDAFEKKFGVRPLEAFGATELSPLAALNGPPHRATGVEQQGAKEGTVGRPIPGMVAKVLDPDTGEELDVDQPGMLWMKGPNVMKGYLNRPDLTAEVVRDGWYMTGDIVFIDAAGFIHITGRLSRFSKIGGEMVPHIRIEEALQKIVNAEEDELKAVVSAVPDSRKGERLIVLHTELEKTPEKICKELAGAGLPNLWIPSPDSFCLVDEIPVLGTGKLDLKQLQDLAKEKFGVTAGSGTSSG